MSLTAILLVGLGSLLVATVVLIWRTLHVRNNTRAMVGNHSQVNRAFLKKRAHDKAGVVHASDSVDTTKIVRRR